MRAPCRCGSYPRATREHVTVVLSGEGADELFGGYLTYRADRIASWLRLIPAPLRRLMVGALGLWPVSNDKISLEYKVKRLMRGSLLTADEAHLLLERHVLQCGTASWTFGRTASRISDLYQMGKVRICAASAATFGSISSIS